MRWGTIQQTLEWGWNIQYASLSVIVSELPKETWSPIMGGGSNLKPDMGCHVINDVKSKVPVHTSTLNLGLLLRGTKQFWF